MPLRLTLRPLLPGVFILLSVALLALLCRGHTPSRLATANLPIWEQHPPRALPPCRLFCLTPPPPGAVQLPPAPTLSRLLQTEENGLLAGAEHSGKGNAGAAGAWLETACLWGRSRADLSAKQDRVALRLMTAQNEDGLFGVRPLALNASPDAPLPGRPWTPREAGAQAACLRGLLAYYALTRRPAAIYAAMMDGNQVLTEPDVAGEEPLNLPLTRLYEETGEDRYLAFARRHAQSGQTDALGNCALYEATGQSSYLQAAQQEWARGQASPDLTAELLLLTGRAEYAAALNHLPPADPALTRAGWALSPQGVTVSAVSDSDFAQGGLHLRQRTAVGSRTITVQTPRPAVFSLRVFLPPGLPDPIRVNGIAQAVGQPGRYALLLRRWRNGDAVTIGSPTSLLATRLSTAAAPR